MILPCPFCGSDDIATEGPSYTQFMCNGCGASTYDQRDHSQAIAAWNRRAANTAVGVKALEWQEAKNGDWHANSEVGEYAVGKVAGYVILFLRRITRWLPDDVDLGGFDTTEEAKAAAQADFNARILSAIEPLQAEGDEPVAAGRLPTVEEIHDVLVMFGEFGSGNEAHHRNADKCAGEIIKLFQTIARLTHPATPAGAEVMESPWRTMDTAPLNGKHCILAVPEADGFIYNVQGAYQAGQWNAVHRDNVQPLYWMPNFLLPDGWEKSRDTTAALSTQGREAE